METEFRSYRPRTHKVRSAKGRQEVVQRFFVGHVNHRHPRAPPVAIAMKQVVMAYGDVEKMPCGNAIGVVIRIVGASGCDGDQC